MNPFEMVVLIVGIGAVASVMRAKHGAGRWQSRFGGGGRDDGDDAMLRDENGAMRDELRGLKERIQVLERLATDDASDARRLDREIEKLRDDRASGRTQSGE